MHGRTGAYALTLSRAPLQSKRQDVIITIDVRDVLNGPDIDGTTLAPHAECTDDFFEDWTSGDENGEPLCILGKTHSFHRMKQLQGHDVGCFLPKDYNFTASETKARALVHVAFQVTHWSTESATLRLCDAQMRGLVACRKPARQLSVRALPALGLTCLRACARSANRVVLLQSCDCSKEDFYCEYGYEKLGSNSKCTEMQGSDAAPACVAIEAEAYQPSKENIRLAHGEECPNLKDFIPDTDGNVRSFWHKVVRWIGMCSVWRKCAALGGCSRTRSECMCSRCLWHIYTRSQVLRHPASWNRVCSLHPDSIF